MITIDFVLLAVARRGPTSRLTAVLALIVVACIIVLLTGQCSRGLMVCLQTDRKCSAVLSSSLFSMGGEGLVGKLDHSAARFASVLSPKFSSSDFEAQNRVFSGPKIELFRAPKSSYFEASSLEIEFGSMLSPRFEGTMLHCSLKELCSTDPWRNCSIFCSALQGQACYSNRRGQNIMMARLGHCYGNLDSCASKPSVG